MTTKKTQPTLEERIAARAAEQAAAKPDHDAKAREDAEMSLPALVDLIETAHRIKADFAALGASADRVFMPAADAGLAIIRDGQAARNVGMILDALTVTVTAVKAQAEATLAAPTPEA